MRKRRRLAGLENAERGGESSAHMLREIGELRAEIDRDERIVHQRRS